MHLESDYLIVGAGASGMAFADTLLAETDATMTIVDRGHSPGGHWNHAYPFVRLHQPSAFYGVASKPLGRNHIDTFGGNEGLCELASGSEVCGYYKQLLHQTFLPSGRVTYLPNSEYGDDGRITSGITGDTHTIAIRRKIVQTSVASGQVPATHTPAFEIADGVTFLTPTGLAEREAPAPQYIVIGSGKTGIDVCLWLLDRGVPPQKITWIMPRDAWFLNRKFFQPSIEHFEFRQQNTLNEQEAILAATSVDDLFNRLEASRNLLRLDPDVRPTAYKCATVTLAELAALRTIRDIVRMGHVQCLEPGRIVLDGGTLATQPQAVHIDCSASALGKQVAQPVFQGERIVLQAVRTCQPTFSAAFIAHCEATLDDDISKNQLCTPIPYPTCAEDWLRMTFDASQNQINWMQNDALRGWLKNCRLDVFAAGARPAEKTPDMAAASARIKETFFPAMAKLNALMSEIPE